MLDENRLDFAVIEGRFSKTKYDHYLMQAASLRRKSSIGQEKIVGTPGTAALSEVAAPLFLIEVAIFA